MQAQLGEMRKKYEKITRQKTMVGLNLERSLKEVDEMVNLSQKVLELSQEDTELMHSTSRTMNGSDEGGGLSHPPPALPGGGGELLRYFIFARFFALCILHFAFCILHYLGLFVFCFLSFFFCSYFVHSCFFI